MSDLLLLPEHRYAKIIEQTRNEDGSELSILNLGPTHPATHGIFQNILLMDGEKILDAEPTIGYIHRAFEKIAENRPFYQINVLTDRMNYCSSPINNMAWWMTVEKLLEITNRKFLNVCFKTDSIAEAKLLSSLYTSI